MFRIIHHFIKKFHKEFYIVEYQVHNSVYIVLIKVGYYEKCEDVFDRKWTSSCLGIYPYPMYKILNIKKINKKIEII